VWIDPVTAQVMMTLRTLAIGIAPLSMLACIVRPNQAADKGTRCWESKRHMAS
jgi:hypothetical protein